MPKDRLIQLLQQADRTAEPAGLPGVDLAERVRRAARRRHNITITVSMAATLMLAVGLLHWANRNPLTISLPDKPHAVAQNTQNKDAPRQVDVKSIVAHQEPTQPDAGQTVETNTEAELAQLRMEIAQLRAEADVGMQVVQELLALQKQQTKLAELDQQLAAIPDPLEEVRRQVEQAAYTMVFHADRKYNQMDLKESAVEDFQRVIQLYPQTRWAAVAHKKLDEIHNNRKGSIL